MFEPTIDVCGDQMIKKNIQYGNFAWFFDVLLKLNIESILNY